MGVSASPDVLRSVLAAPSGLSIWLIQGWPHIAYYLVNSTYLANSMHVDVLVRVGDNLYKAFLACFVASTSKNGDDAANNAATESGHGTVTNETLHSSKTCCLSLSTYSARRSQCTNPVREANGRHGDAVLDAFAARASSTDSGNKGCSVTHRGMDGGRERGNGRKEVAR